MMEEKNKDQNIENSQDIELSNDKQEAASETEKPKKSVQREILEWVQAIVIAVVLALLVRNFIFTVVRVDGQSMEPTLQHNDRMIVWRLGYEPKAGDIVIFNPPAYPENTYWVKRVIATEGQTVKIDYTTNSVYVDGEKIDEPYLGEEMEERMYNFSEVEVPKDCVFVLGDNRNHSSDGRMIGPISEDCIVGEAVLRFWPVNNINTFGNK
jgi:signal peptidase I